MKSTLVLTGWGLPDYAAAAAAALRACNGADLSGVSKRRLPEILAKEGKGREAVFVLGVARELKRAVMEAKRQRRVALPRAVRILV